MSECDDFSTVELIRLQSDKHEALKQIFSNFKKDGAARKTKTYFSKRIAKIEQLYHEFSDSHKVIVSQLEEQNNQYFTKKISANFEELYLEVICAVTENLEELFPPTETTQASAACNTTTPAPNSSRQVSSIQLPNLPVPTFTGKFVDWPTFNDSFSQLIHQNEDLNNIQRFHFLKKALPCDRDLDIHQMDLTDHNYTVAWEILGKRYNNPRILFMHHMNTLFSLPALVKEKSEDLKVLINSATVCITSIKRLNIPIDQCDHWIAHFLASRLPKETHQAWEFFLGNKTHIPKFSDFESFLHSRLVTLDAIENRNIAHEPQVMNLKASPKPSDRRQKPEAKFFHSIAQNNKERVEVCPLCKKDHGIRFCSSFLEKDCFERKSLVQRYKLCINCLSHRHLIAKCTSSKNCFQCGGRHHTMLHIPTNTNQSKNAIAAAQPTSSSSNDGCQASWSSTPPTPVHSQQPPVHPSNHTVHSHKTSIADAASVRLQNSSSTSSPKILLATARVNISNPYRGHKATVRALIDPGSEGTLVSEALAQALQLKRTSICAEISGVGQGANQHCKHAVSFSLGSCTDPTFTLFVEYAYVLKSFNSILPSQRIVPQEWPHAMGLALADPNFNIPQKIDLIIGADLMSQILLPQIRIGSSDEPIAQSTRFGWILLGQTSSVEEMSRTINCHHATVELERLTHRFFDFEQIPEERFLSAEEQWCEDFFSQTHQRQSNGKYLVRLPLKSIFDPNQTLGRSKQTALNRFHQLERRLERDPKLSQQYRDAIEDYFELDQLSRVTTTESQHRIISPSGKPSQSSCVLPHHAVIKEESVSTKVRIVFDASAKTSNGRSLNDMLSIGPPLQNELPAILLKWRMHQFVFTADIQKMYRCIDMHSEDSQYQRILWRNKTNEIQEFALSTVTFGTASAPFTAIRVLHQIAEDEKARYPLAKKILKEDMYVDDILTGSDTIENALEIQQHVKGALQTAGMHLRKWASNHPTLLESIPMDDQCGRALQPLDSQNTVKTLGMFWQPTTDSFYFKINFTLPSIATKRNVLSTIARLYDPLGLIAPIIISAKIILKDIWTTKLRDTSTNNLTSIDWDDPLPNSLENRWHQFADNFTYIESLKIPRWVKFFPKSISVVELHAFSDGSSSAYAASVYLRLVYNNGTIYSYLLTSKSRVTPTKPISIPRVELCGALLAAKLVTWVKKYLVISIDDINTFFWTDASIVLFWVKGDVTRWKTFVANRIAKILDHTSPHNWNHVKSKDNPSDCATRGLTLNELANFDLWWYGPSWLGQPSENWPKPKFAYTEIDPNLLETENRRLQINIAVSAESIVYKYSSLNRLTRVIALILRFRHNANKQNTANKLTGPISVNELQHSITTICRLVQQASFHSEKNHLQNRKPLPAKSKLTNLTPFIDPYDILRVGGRLQHAQLSYGQKHPIILPPDHHVTTLIIMDAHHNTLHGGLQLTLSYIRKKFWVINARSTVKYQLRKCIQCFRAKPQITPQLMGNLPYHRVSPPTRPFFATGIDYTGAIELKASRFRGHTTYKGYIVLFICLATKAIHLEAVTGLSTEHFMMALQRFIGRRGICHEIYSDCGTNFTGAAKTLQRSQKEFEEAIKKDIIPQLALRNIQWHFNPPHSPNFGGLWEANIKSVKYHLKRITEGLRFTYEELSTVLVRIEACLNSRPLCPLTSDPNDLEVLTPGHFLIGDSLLAPPEETHKDINISKHYLALQSLIRQFWSKWSSDWLSHLQSRPKWHKQTENLQRNDLVIVKDDRLPPNQWVLARIIDVHPGPDNLVRVVTVQTKTGIFKRSVSKICRLPIPNHTEPQTNL